MKATHKILIMDSDGYVVWEVTGTLERCYNYMWEKSFEPTLSGYTWELSYM